MPQVTLAARSTADDVLAGVDLVNKIILITGCNSGIGFESMRALLEKVVASHAGARG
jgi:NADP-dependent 3-hydroxy acid dehydrogenase YdfG